jgi:hypothetical protein
MVLAVHIQPTMGWQVLRLLLMGSVLCCFKTRWLQQCRPAAFSCLHLPLTIVQTTPWLKAAAVNVPAVAYTDPLRLP